MKFKKSKILLTLQLIFIFLFAISGPAFAKNTILLIIELLGLFLGLCGVYIMTVKSRFNAYPEPAKDSNLLDIGPYKYIRNPMYLAIIFVMLALLFDKFIFLRLILLISEIFILLEKIKIEEKLLTKKFNKYALYKTRTKRLIPFIY